MGLHVPKTKSGTVAEWHAYFRERDLDYRQDNNYVVVYVQQLGLRLISTTMTAYDQWKPKVGKYIVMSYSKADPKGAVGHAIGVTVTQGKDALEKKIHDRQKLRDEKKPFYVRYVFQVP
jgi:hypothetical protein